MKAVAVGLSGIWGSEIVSIRREPVRLFDEVRLNKELFWGVERCCRDEMVLDCCEHYSTETNEPIFTIKRRNNKIEETTQMRKSFGIILDTGATKSAIEGPEKRQEYDRKLKAEGESC